MSEESVMRIFVANLALAITEDELERLFESYGLVDRAHIITDRVTGHSQGVGFVEMPNATEARAAIAGLNGTSLKGRQLNVTVARRQQERVCLFPAILRRFLEKKFLC
jgi:RNA recognition motif-containing protein